MAISEHTDDGAARRVSSPLPRLWPSEAEAFLTTFEPENPHIFIPRQFGLGWSVNWGAVAARVGLIRPDDSLPDLADHLPAPWRRAVAAAPYIGAAAVAVTALRVARLPRAATHWNLAGRATRFSTGRAVALGYAALAAGVAGIPRLLPRADRDRAAIHVSEQATVAGAQAFVAASLIASAQAAKHPEKRQILALVAPVLWPAVTAGTQLACVKRALAEVGAQLAQQREPLTGYGDHQEDGQ